MFIRDTHDFRMFASRARICSRALLGPAMGSNRLVFSVFLRHYFAFFVIYLLALFYWWIHTDTLTLTDTNRLTWRLSILFFVTVYLKCIHTPLFLFMFLHHLPCASLFLFISLFRCHFNLIFSPHFQLSSACCQTDLPVGTHSDTHLQPLRCWCSKRMRSWCGGCSVAAEEWWCCQVGKVALAPIVSG